MTLEESITQKEMNQVLRIAIVFYRSQLSSEVVRECEVNAQEVGTDYERELFERLYVQYKLSLEERR